MIYNFYNVDDLYVWNHYFSFFLCMIFYIKVNFIRWLPRHYFFEFENLTILVNAPKTHTFHHVFFYCHQSKIKFWFEIMKMLWNDQHFFVILDKMKKFSSKFELKGTGEMSKAEV